MRYCADVAIVDYGMGNLFSVANACAKVGLEAIITDRPDIAGRARAVILPGVGAFGDAMNNLSSLGFVEVLRNAALEGKPFLGVCLGMQLLMSESDEFGRHKGLDILPGSVIRFPEKDAEGNRVKVPQVAWNRIRKVSSETGLTSKILNGVEDDEFMYFVHSFYVVPQNEEDIVTNTEYCGIRYCSAIARGQTIGTQFHPEKSGPPGLDIYRNFTKIIRGE